MRGGRPSSYTLERGRAICERLANGESLVSIARDRGMPSYCGVFKWLRDIPAFQEMYVAARQVQADYLFDEAREVALAATPATVWADRLRFDVIRWQAARLAPKKYVERLVVEEAAAARARAGQEEPLQVVVCGFTAGPNGETLVIPPRNAEEEAAWVRAHGRPYDGPTPTGWIPGRYWGELAPP